MSYQNNDHEMYLLETSSHYKTKEDEIILHEKLLTREESIQYILNNHEQDLSNEIEGLKNNNLLDFLSELSKRSIQTLPFQISLVGNGFSEEYKNAISKDFQLLQSKLITNNKETNDYMIDQLKNELLTCNTFDIIVSFIRGSGLNMLTSTLEILKKKGIRGRILTTDYMYVTEPNALRVLQNFSNVELKVYKLGAQANKSKSFHTKAYIFHRHNKLSSAIVGSSNISAAALKTGEEWNIRTYERATDSIYNQTYQRFNELWSHEFSQFVDEKFILEYENIINKNKDILVPFMNSLKGKTEEESIIEPNSMQKSAIANLLQSIQNGHKRGLAIAATGTGKTYLAAMSAKQLIPTNVLFIAHRQELLEGALKTFKKIFDEEPSEEFVIYKGSKRDLKKFTFASIQSLANDYQQYTKEHFDLIIIDEFHHATAKNYMKIINYFEPNFLLGLTATPERTDHGDIYELAEYNVIIDVRLRNALDSELLVPFQYYGISDETVELADSKGINEEELTKKLNTNERVDFIINKIKQYTLCGPMKCLAFCQNIKHAQFMNTEFQKLGFNSMILTGQNKDEERAAAISNLQSDNHPLEIIFTVDLFNEGTDIPQVNLILFLRPTESAIIFIQQLGRGLRKYDGKEYVVVLDFVTNDRKSYLVPIALNGNEGFVSKQRLKTSVINNFNDLSETVHIELDYKSKDKILEAIEQENFMSAPYIKQEAKQFLSLIRLETKDNKRKLSIMDFYSFENAPSLSFLFGGHYSILSQINKAIKETREVDEKILGNKNYFELFKKVTDLIPVITLYDFLALVLPIIKGNLSRDEMIEYIENVFSVKLNTNIFFKIELAMERASQITLDGKILFEFENNTLTNMNEFPDDIMKELFEYLKFGIVDFKKRQDINNINKQNELILYQQYSQKQVAILVGYDKDVRSWREGVKQFNGDHYLFVNLYKEEDIQEDQKFNDYFVSEDIFHWESQSKTSRDSKTGQQYQNHQRDNKKIFLFVRRKQKEDGKVLPFYYLGQVDFISAEGDKPIKILWKLHDPIPQEIRNELEFIKA